LFVGGKDFKNLYGGVLFHGMLDLEVIFGILRPIKRGSKLPMILLREMQLGLIVIDNSGNSLLV